MNNCNTSPLFIPTTVIAQVKNLDAVDVAADNVSCKKLTVNGENITNVLQNVSNSAIGSTTFTGNLIVTGTLDATDVLAVNMTIPGTSTLGTVSCTSINDTGSLTVGGASSVQALTATSLTSSGDLTVDTNVLKVDTGNNRVGVNTTAPSEALEVTGNIKGSGTLTVAGNMTIDTSTLVVAASSNRVGVNTATPTLPLDVVGDTQISTTENAAFVKPLRVYAPNISGTNSANFQLGKADQAYGFGSLSYVPNDTVASSNATMRIGLGGVVPAIIVKGSFAGINNTTPTAALDVTGDVKSSGQVTCAGITTSSNVTQSAGTTTLKGTTVETLNVTGFITAGGAATFSGISASSLTTSGYLNVNSGVLYADTNNDKVGINTVTPSEALDVVGNVKASGTITGATINASSAINVNSVPVLTQISGALTTFNGSTNQVSFALGENYTRISLINVYCTTVYQVTLDLTSSGMTASGETYTSWASTGSAGTRTAWAASSVYLQTSAASIQANSRIMGFIDVIRINATTYQVVGKLKLTGNATTGWESDMAGTLTGSAGTVKILSDTSFVNTSRIAVSKF